MIALQLNSQRNEVTVWYSGRDDVDGVYVIHCRIKTCQ